MIKPEKFNPLVLMPWLLMWVFAPAPLYIWAVLEIVL